MWMPCPDDHEKCVCYAVGPSPTDLVCLASTGERLCRVGTCASVFDPADSDEQPCWHATPRYHSPTVPSRAQQRRGRAGWTAAWPTCVVCVAAPYTGAGQDSHVRVGCFSSVGCKSEMS